MLNSVDKIYAKQMANKRFLRVPISFSLTAIKEITFIVSSFTAKGESYARNSKGTLKTRKY